MLKKGEFIKVLYEKTVYKEKIDSIRELSFYMDGKEFELKKLNLILVSHRYTKLRKIFRVFFWFDLGLAHLTAILLIFYMFYTLDPDGNEGLASLGNLLLYILFATPFLIVSTLLLHFRSKLYELNLMKDWKIESVMN